MKLYEQQKNTNKNYEEVADNIDESENDTSEENADKVRKEV